MAKKVIPKKKNKEDTSGKLMKAALDVFSKDGYDAATTRNIAKKAGVNESLINRYFEGKHGLFMAVKTQFRENYLNEFLTYEASDTLAEEFVKFIKSRLQKNAREKKFIKLVFSRAILDAKFREDIDKYARMKFPELEERFERFRAKGQIRQDVDLTQMISVLQAFAFAISMLANAIECLPPDDADKLIASTANFLTRGISPKK